MSVISLVGCRPDYAWERSSASVTPVVAPPSIGALSASAEDGSPSPPPADGAYERCAAGFVSTGEPVRDVTRLGLACGNSLGLTRSLPSTLEGAIAADGVSVTVPLELSRGRCYRIFAASTPEVGDLVTELRSSRGTTIATDHAHGSISIVQPDRPVCALDDDRGSIVVSAGSGHGRFALEIYDDRSADSAR